MTLHLTKSVILLSSVAVLAAPLKTMNPTLIVALNSGF